MILSFICLVIINDNLLEYITVIVQYMQWKLCIIPNKELYDAVIQIITPMEINLFW